MHGPDAEDPGAEVSRERYIVGPAEDCDGYKPWTLSRNGCELGRYDTQKGAIDTGVMLATNRLKLLGYLSELIIMGEDGRIRDNRTYGDDPPETNG